MMNIKGKTITFIINNSKQQKFIKEKYYSYLFVI